MTAWSGRKSRARRPEQGQSGLEPWDQPSPHPTGCCCSWGPPGPPREPITHFHSGDTEAQVAPGERGTSTGQLGWAWSCSRRGVSSSGITCLVIHGAAALLHIPPNEVPLAAGAPTAPRTRCDTGEQPVTAPPSPTAPETSGAGPAPALRGAKSSKPVGELSCLPRAAAGRASA